MSIADAVASASAYLTEHPDEARYRDSHARARVGSGLQAEVTGPGGERLITDMPAGIGGTGTAPSPGWLLRAATASCVASLVAIRAAATRVVWRRFTAMLSFAGFTRDAIQFLADLAENNDRAWFQPRKADYERLLKEPMEALCASLAERFDARGILLLADPKRSPFRIYRDTRFSRDKAPYKTHVAATFPWVDAVEGVGERADANPHGNGGYFNFQPGEMYTGGGMWMPEKPRLDAFRRAIVDDPDRVRAALEEPTFVAWFGGAQTHDALKRVPPGYPPDHPMAEHFKWKDVIFGRRLSDDEVCSPDLPDRLADGYAAALPVFRFLATLRG